MIGYLVFAVILLSFFLSASRYSPRKRTGTSVSGKNIWLDTGRNTKPFYHPKYAIVAKPDAINRVKGQLQAIEYKSRYGPVFQSDIVQVKAAALAARASGYDIRSALVRTSNQSKLIDLPRSDKDLFEDIRPYYEQAKHIKSGKHHLAVASPDPKKCAKCAYYEHCPNAS
jgi:CRISPR/Cas system-associated exonuclease Cas4 (RecB family)